MVLEAVLASGADRHLDIILFRLQESLTDKRTFLINEPFWPRYTGQFDTAVTFITDTFVAQLA